MEQFNSQIEVDEVLSAITVANPKDKKELLARFGDRLTHWYESLKNRGGGKPGKNTAWRFESVVANVVLDEGKVQVFQPNKKAQPEQPTLPHMEATEELISFHDLCVELTGHNEQGGRVWMEIDDWDVAEASNGRWRWQEIPALWEQAYKCFGVNPEVCRRLHAEFVFDYAKRLMTGHANHVRFLLSASAIGIPTTLESLAMLEAGKYWQKADEQHSKPRHQTNIDERKRDFDLACEFERKFPEDAMNEKKRISDQFAERASVTQIKATYDFWREKDNAGPIHPIDFGRD